MITKPDIALVRSLADKRNRVENGLFVAEGHKIVEEAMASGFNIRRLFSCDEFFESDNCEPVSRKEIERMSSLRNPQGIIALVEMPEYDVPQNIGEKLTIALDGIQDPGNMGTIIRLADWFGVEDIICSVDSADCFNPKVVQATMGAIFRVRVHYMDLAEALRVAHEQGARTYGAFLDGDNIYSADLGDAGSGVIVMGGEGAGITPELETIINRRVYIPPYPNKKPSSESLNVAVATAIICSEFRRR